MLRTHKSKLLAPVLVLVGACGIAYSQQSAPQRSAAQNESRKLNPLGIAPESTPLFSELRNAYELTDQKKLDEAAAGYQAALAKAEAAHDQPGMALAHGGLARVLARQDKHSDARKQGEQALAILRSLQNQQGIAEMSQYLGIITFYLRDLAASREYYAQALPIFDALGMLKEKAITLRAAELSQAPDGDRMLQESLAISRRIGDKALEASVLQSIGDAFFSRGQLDAAQEQYEHAIALLREAGEEHDLAYTLISEGRLQRAHGHPEKAIPLYQEALALQQKNGDRFGATRSTNAMGVAYAALGEHVSAIQCYERALAMAREASSEPLINFQLGNLAAAYNTVGRYQEALGILKELLPKDTDHAEYRYESIGVANFKLGRAKESLEAYSKALEIAAARDNWDVQRSAYQNRAEAEEQFGEQEAALNDARQALHVIENVRGRLVPSDFMKRGFSEANQSAYGLYVRLLEHAGRPAQALEVAEEARSRAFLDLMATRDLQSKVAPRHDPPQSFEIAAKTSPGSVLVRGGNSPRLPQDNPPKTELEIPSSSSAQPFTFSQLQATARRLNSTIVSYWVTGDRTYIWVISAEGSPHTVQVHASWKDLEKIIAQLAPGQDAIQAKDEVSERKTRLSENPTRKSPGAHQLSARGGTTLTVASAQAQGWRDLYRLLIAPVEEWLPQTPGSLLTIEPHGPLLMLPFAALRDSHGRYLLERFSLNYTPAVSLMQFTEEEKHQIQDLPAHYLLIADPAGMPPAPDRSLLPGLPGSRREVAAVARLLPAGKATVLEGRGAEEDRVANLAGQNTVIHFATHGIIRDDEPFESYLALGANPGNPREDGRLTAEKIYGMALHADLVFLSACRSGQGKISGDGLVGLTRAFWYAGTPSVIASLWDVADEPTARLVAQFYRARLQGKDKSRALRSAQLHLLRQLRAGQVTAHTAGGELRLSEDPLFWAGFVLQGEP